jgi:hypothetical protein
MLRPGPNAGKNGQVFFSRAYSGARAGYLRYHYFSPEYRAPILARGGRAKVADQRKARLEERGSAKLAVSGGRPTVWHARTMRSQISAASLLDMLSLILSPCASAIPVGSCSRAWLSAVGSQSSPGTALGGI